MSSLKDLMSLGGIIPNDLVKKEIKFTLDDDTEHTATVFVRRLSVGLQEEIYGSETNVSSRTAKMISEAVSLGESGAERISYEDAYKMHPGLALAMVEAIREVNRRKERKN